MEKNIRFLIESNYSSMRKSEKKIAELFIENQISAKDINIDTLSRKGGVSQPTVVRFSRSLGFEGFKEFKTYLIEKGYFKEDDDEYNLMTQFEMDINDDISDVPSKIIASNIKQLKNTLKNISSEDIEKAVSAIDKAGKVVIFASENSCIVADDLSIKLVYMGIDVIYSSDYIRQSVYASNLNKNDVAIAISYCGKTKNTVEAAKIAKRTGATVITITNSYESIINKYSDIIICSGNEKIIYKEAIVSRCSQLAIIDMIYMGLMVRKPKHYSKVLKKNSKIIEEHVIK
ncbi:MurR/RpiR family transcriptional regulator [Peptacetobacter hominis]|uniref:MurR/RpiR family transcriptional regulator n=1 Tax=Peptacetobacter hominis TaxID=2743610 RepID=A0A544QWT9_9FIRM|nr:MurR/RpiR family transcriptional regulator [Peptacetobacter hominis]TQQ85150.1 MurR/RpiR family transcriptional regulator [Peptacetobacter hominis]